MRYLLHRIVVVAFSVILLAAWAVADEGPLDKSEPKGITPEEIIKRFSAKEKEFKEARDLYTYRQDVKLQASTETRKRPVSRSIRYRCSTTAGRARKRRVRSPIHL